MGDPNEVAEKFVDHFSSVYVHDTPVVTPRVAEVKSNTSGETITVPVITESQVLHAFKILKPIPTYICKGCKEYLVSPLTYLFNLCIQKNTFPKIWKITKITPVPKGDKTEDMKNHRPVALLSIPAKLMESTLYLNIFNQIKHRISSQQHGFYRSRSVQSNLLHFTQFIFSSFDRGEQVDAVYTDFQKAFDKVNHRILLQKMENLNFSKDLLLLFSSYLKNRRQYVAYKGFESRKSECPSGVPQGSNLGPLPFLLFINDITDVVTSSLILLYADDIKLCKSINYREDVLAAE